jgi:hypothetical protein
MKYWVYLNSKIEGPYEIHELISNPFFNGETLVCESNLSGKNFQDWKKASNVFEISKYSGVLTANPNNSESAQLNIEEFNYPNILDTIDEIEELSLEEEHKESEIQYNEKESFDFKAMEIEEQLETALWDKNILSGKLSYKEKKEEEYQKRIEYLENKIKEIMFQIKSIKEKQNKIERDENAASAKDINRLDSIKKQTKIEEEIIKDKNIFDRILNSDDYSDKIKRTEKNIEDEISNIEYLKDIQELSKDAAGEKDKKKEEAIIKPENKIKVDNIEFDFKLVNDRKEEPKEIKEEKVFKKLSAFSTIEDIENEKIIDTNVSEKDDVKDLKTLSNINENAIYEDESSKKEIEKEANVLDFKEIDLKTLQNSPEQKNAFEEQNTLSKTEETKIENEKLLNNNLNISNNTLSSDIKLETSAMSPQIENIVKEEPLMKPQMQPEINVLKLDLMNQKTENNENKVEEKKTEIKIYTDEIKIQDSNPTIRISDNELEKTQLANIVKNEFKSKVDVKPVKTAKVNRLKLIFSLSVVFVITISSILFVFNFRKNAHKQNLMSAGESKAQDRNLSVSTSTSNAQSEIKTEKAEIITQTAQTNSLQQINQNTQKAIDVVKEYNLSSGRGTISQWFLNSFSNIRQVKEEWTATLLQDKIFVVQYRLLRQKQEPLVYQFEVDIEKGTIVRGINNNAIDLLEMPMKKETTIDKKNKKVIASNPKKKKSDLLPLPDREESNQEYSISNKSKKSNNSVKITAPESDEDLF